MRGCVDGDTLGRAHAKLRAALRVLLPLSSLHSVIRCFLSSVFDSGDLLCRCYTMRPVEKERNASDDIVFYARTTKFPGLVNSAGRAAVTLNAMDWV